MKMISVEELKSKTWVYRENGQFVTTECENEIYEMTGFHIPTAKKCENGNLIKYHLLYQKKDNEITLSVYVWFEHGNGSPIFTDSITLEGDVLGLFPTTEETVESFLNCSGEEFLEKLKERDRLLYNEIETFFQKDVLDNLDGSQKEDIAYEYIEDNPNDSFDKVRDCLSDSDIKDFVKDYINDNL